MKQLVIMAFVATLLVGITIGGVLHVSSQSPGTTRTLRRIPVSGQTVTTLPRGKNYVVDLTQRGVKYEFDPKAGQIDFSRVVVHTARRDMTMASFLELMIPKGELAWFKYSSQPFSLQTRPPGTVPRPPTLSPVIGCYTGSKPWCSCRGQEDCEGMIKYMGVCQEDTIVCVNNPLTGEKICSCMNKSQPS